MKINKYIWMLILLVTGTVLHGQGETFTAAAPAVVKAGEQFQYVIEGSTQGDVVLPDLDGFQLLAGPFSSYSSHSQWVNGKMSMETVVTYTHVLKALKKGNLVIPPSTIRAGRKEYKTNKVEIIVGGGADPNPQAGGSQGAGGNQGTSGASGTATQSGQTDPVFLRVVPSKKEVYLGEQFVCGLKVYTRIDTRPASTASDLPYEGFYKKSVDPDASAERQDIGGQSFVSQVIQRHILIPQKSGKIVIEPYESEWMVQQRVQRRSSNSVFDSFFDDPFFNSMQWVPSKLASKPVTINVKPLPAGAPGGFTGGVGVFSVKATLSAEEVSVNEALSLKVTIRGSGNLPLMGEPEVSLPPDHDLYDVTRSLNTSTSGNQISGSVTFEYPIIARHAGKFRIAPIRFTWFNPEKESYQTMTTQEFGFTVLKGEAEEGAASVYVPGMMQENVENLGTDIRDIMRTPPAFTPVAFTLMGKGWFRFMFLLTVLLVILVIILIRMATRRNADLRLVRNRHASRSARNRLKNADKYRKTAESDRFYEEVGKAIWGYMADKLNIEISAISSDVIARELTLANIDQELIAEFSRILDESEFSRFAPSSGKSDMDLLYKDAVQLIKNLENSLR